MGWKAGIAGLALLGVALSAQAQPSPQIVAVSEAPVIANFQGEVGGTGPFPARGFSATSLPTHTIYAPVTLPPGKMPVFAWAEGGCADNGAQYEKFLRQIASQGILVMAIGPPRQRVERPAGAAPPPPPNPGGPESGTDPTQPSQLIDALNWAKRENSRRGSRFYHRLDVNNAAVGGHSCGGLQALAVSADPRIRTTLVMNSGVYVRPGGRSGVRIGKDALTRLHAPALYVLGGPTDIAYVNGMDDFDKITTVPVMAINLAVGHGGTYQQADGGPYGAVVSAWLRWRLLGDDAAGRMFLGRQCGLCTDATWTVARKGLG